MIVLVIVPSLVFMGCFDLGQCVEDIIVVVGGVWLGNGFGSIVALIRW